MSGHCGHDVGFKGKGPYIGMFVIRGMGVFCRIRAFVVP